MRHIIHRGQHEIGGICIEVVSDDGTRILLDLGMPLVTPDGGDYPRDTPQRPTQELLGEDILREIPGLYPHDTSAPAFDAIILTHSHLDHVGLAHHAHSSIPVYGSDGTISIMEVGKVFFPDCSMPTDLRRIPAGGCLQIGSLLVTAIPVDHSAPDSRALLVEADGQRLLFTGDLRAHGRTGFRFENLLKDTRLHGVDWLITEGTTIGSSRDSHGLETEQDVEEKLFELARTNAEKLIAVFASGQNLDRLVSCFRAARKTGRTLVIDPYQAYVLMKLESLSTSVPQFSWDGIKVSFPPYQVDRLRDAGMMELVYEMAAEAKVSTSELAANPGRYLMCTRSNLGMTKVLDVVGVANVEVIWSMWGGYWERDNCALREWTASHGLDAHFIHSGGHAWPRDLKRLVDAIGAKQTIWVHTDASDEALAEIG